jgi:ABC-2 type transport system permease protein
MSIVFVLSGHMFPLDLLPEPFAEFTKWLPFQFLAYFPSKLFLQGDSWTTGKMTFEIVRMLGTIVVLAWSVVVVYRIGLRRYSAFGG